MMATGYTANVADGKLTEFPAFAMQCARAFGALVMMRDDAADAAIPEVFEPDTKYHDEALATAKRDMAAFGEMGNAACIALRDAEHEQAVESWRKSNMDRVATRERYEAMLTKVHNWVPPTKDHDGMKAFMVEQLETSIKFDCYESEAPKLQMLSDWRANREEQLTRDINYHTEHRQKEIERAASRTKWLRDLRASLATTPK